MADKTYSNDPQASRYQKPRRASIFDSKKKGIKLADMYTSKKVKAKDKNQFLIEFFFFFFKQKTAYDISECDWSSDVCSSDLFFFFKQKTAYEISECDWSSNRKSTRLNSSHIQKSRMPSSA